MTSCRHLGIIIYYHGLPEVDFTSELLEKLLICLLCATVLPDTGGLTLPVVSVLCVITCTCLIQAADNRLIQYIIISFYIVTCFIKPCFITFFPVPAYDISRKKLFPAVLPAVFAFYYRISEGLTVREAVGILIFCLAAAVIEQLDRKVTDLRHELIVTRDSAVENNNELRDTNRRLLAAQDSEVHLATLKERNRIAREIHDNVGHMLTRTILQTGALQIINKDENLKEPLESIKSTLDTAMTEIRKSVHDLHDESIDLEALLREAIAPLRERFDVNFEYDMPGHVDGKVKYCFAAIVKEAVNNIIKHSKGDRAEITVRDHPGMLTLIIRDNGPCPERIGDGGIGLENMRERVNALKGNINISSGSDGFKIFVSIMK